MKSKFVSLVAIVTTSIYPTIATAATVGTATVDDPIAQGPNSTTLAAMTTQCNALAAARDLADPVAQNIWTAEVVEGDVTLVSGPTEAGSARVKSNIQHAGDFIPGVTYIQGDPFRIGGSVNMFGDQYATSGSWTDSTYDFTNNFNSTFAYAFDCEISQSVYHPEEFIPGHGVIGRYFLDEGQSPNAADPCSDKDDEYTNNNYGQHWGNCTFVKDQDATEDETIEAYYDDPVVVETVAGTPINQDQIDMLSGHEAHGGPVQAAGGPFHIGQVVICISPSTTTKKGVPGAWRQQNGYTGDKCTTDWFVNHAAWGAGTESSNGTYISVPDYSYY